MISRLNSSQHSRQAALPRPGRRAPLSDHRRRIDGVATLFELTGDRFGQIHTATAIDYCDGGMSACSDDLIPPGTTVSIGFQSPQCSSQHGHVVQCLPGERGYLVDVAFQPGRCPASA